MGTIFIISFIVFFGFGAIYLLFQWNVALYVCAFWAFVLLCVIGTQCDIWYSKMIAHEVLGEVNNSGIIEKTHDESKRVHLDAPEPQKQNLVCHQCKKPFVGTDKNIFKHDNGALMYVCDDCLCKPCLTEPKEGNND